MAQAKCSRGHIYDSDIYGGNCPYCGRSEKTINFDEPAFRPGRVPGPADADDTLRPGDRIGPPQPVSFVPDEMEKTIPIAGQSWPQIPKDRSTPIQPAPVGKTMPVPNQGQTGPTPAMSFAPDDPGKTIPIPNQGPQPTPGRAPAFAAANVGHTVPIPNPGQMAGFVPDGVGKTEPVKGGSGIGGSNVKDFFDEKTGMRVYYREDPDGENKQDRTKEQTVPTDSFRTGKPSADPVVGWLVCVTGAERGMSFKLCSRMNSIGRDQGSDVCLQDSRIAADCHAMLDYDALNNDFYLVPRNNRSTIYVNQAPTYFHCKLSAFDKIRLGKTELMFIPFCSDKFRWDDETLDL